MPFLVSDSCTFMESLCPSGKVSAAHGLRSLRLSQTTLKGLGAGNRWKSTEAREDLPKASSTPPSAAVAPNAPAGAPAAQVTTAITKSKSKDVAPDAANIRELLRLAKPQWKLITAGVGFVSCLTSACET